MIFYPEIPIGQVYSKFLVLIDDHANTTDNFSANHIIINNIFDNTSTRLDPNFEFTANPDDPSPLILFWNYANFWGPNEDLLTLEQIDAALFQICPVESQCRITANRSLIDESSAVVIRLRSFEWNQLSENSIRRQPDQYFVMVEFESPAQEHYVDMTGREEFFNLTMTYRNDSDIVFPFAYFLAHDDRSKIEEDIDRRRFEQTTNGKTKLIAWFASNCDRVHSNRYLLVQRLEQYVGVDKYGRCGNLSCPKQSGSWKSSMPCYDMLTRDYKFYLSLENSICQDYITEKFFDVLRLTRVIPIVFERKLLLDTIREEETASVVNTSFIAVDDFESIEQLAEYLKYLDGNTTAYLEYFDWRKQYRVVKDRTTTLPGCELCRILKEKKPRVFTDVQNWWYESAQCHPYK